MKTQYRVPNEGAGGGPAERGGPGARFGGSDLDTYKQFAQPSIHAGFQPFWGSEMKPFVRTFRRAIYWPVDHLYALPGGPLRWLWLARFVVWIDAPLRAILIRGSHAKSTN